MEKHTFITHMHMPTYTWTHTHIHAHTYTQSHTYACTHGSTKNAKGGEIYELKRNVLQGLLLSLGNFHVNGKIENVNKSLLFTPDEIFYLYRQIPVYSVRAVN